MFIKNCKKVKNQVISVRTLSECKHLSTFDAINASIESMTAFRAPNHLPPTLLSIAIER